MQGRAAWRGEQKRDLDGETVTSREAGDVATEGGGAGVGTRGAGHGCGDHRVR